MARKNGTTEPKKRGKRIRPQTPKAERLYRRLTDEEREEELSRVTPIGR
jgi:hypothetical protein